MKYQSWYKYNSVLCCLFILAVMLRLLALWIAPEVHLSTNAKSTYLGGARLILHGQGLKDPAYPIFTPPLYAILIATGSWLFGDDQLPIKVFQILLDSLTCILLYAIIHEFFAPEVSLLAGIGWAVYPFAIYATLYIGSEAIFTFLLCLSVLLALKGFKRQSWKFYCSAGIVLGLATLTRGTTQFLPVFLFGVLIIFYRSLPKGVMQGCFMFMISFAITISPWTVRNYLVLHEFVPVATGGSVVLQGASDEFLTIENKRKYEGYFKQLKERGIHLPSNDEGPVAMDRFFIRAGVESYKIRFENDPLSIVPFMAMKLGRLWYSTESGNNERVILLINSLIYVPALIGVWIAWSRHRQYLWILGPVILYFVFLHWLTLPLFRYMLPVMPFIIGLAGLGITTVVDDHLRKSRIAAL